MQATQHLTGSTSRRSNLALAGVGAVIVASFAVGAVVGRFVTLPAVTNDSASQTSVGQALDIAAQPSLIEFRAGEHADLIGGAATSTNDAEQRLSIEFRAGERDYATSGSSGATGAPAGSEAVLGQLNSEYLRGIARGWFAPTTSAPSVSSPLIREMYGTTYSRPVSLGWVSPSVSSRFIREMYGTTYTRPVSLGWVSPSAAPGPLDPKAHRDRLGGP